MGGGNRQGGLPHAPGAGQGDQPGAGRRQQADELLELGHAAHEVGRLGGEIGAVDGLQLGELAGSQLVQLDRAHVFQLMATEVMESVRSDQFASGLRDEHLTAVTGSADPGREVHIQPDIAISGRQRLTGMHPNPDTHLTAQLLLGILGCCQRIRGAFEHHEEGISLGIDLDAVTALEDRPQHPPVLSQSVWIVTAELLQERGRPGDIGEHHRDCARGEGWHRGRIIAGHSLRRLA